VEGIKALDKAGVFDSIKQKFNDSIFSNEEAVIVVGDSLELLSNIPDNSVALILTDPPYHSTKKGNIVGDKAFIKDADYIEWMRCYAVEWKRVLKHSGSIFCFCSSAMSAQMQVMFSEHFNVLSEIVWTKPNAPGYDGWKQKMKKEALRQWYPHSERIIFMENATDGNLFKSHFGSQLTAWRKQAKMSTITLAELAGMYGNVNHGGTIANWEAGRNIPSKEQYSLLKSILTEAGVDDIPDYEDTIRPFNVRKDVEFTDIWTFENVRQYNGKHPAEKPVNLLEHAINATTYSGDIVLDCFSGSGATGEAAINLGRKSILFEIDADWGYYAANRLSSVLFTNSMYVKAMG
jgi:site-specific DNA-methyltransferase (adenine-specific)